MSLHLLSHWNPAEHVPVHISLGCVFGIIVLFKCWPSFHLRQAGSNTIPTSLLIWCFLDDVQCLLTKRGVYYSIQRVQFWSYLARLCNSSISKVSLNVVQWTWNVLQQAFVSAMECCMVSMRMGHGGWVHCLLFSLKKSSWGVCCVKTC